MGLVSILCQKGLRASRKPPSGGSGFVGLEALALLRRGRRRRAQEVVPQIEGQPPIARPRIIIKTERHPPGADIDPALDLGVVGGGDAA